MEMDEYQIDLAIAEDLAERERKKAKKRKKRLRAVWDRAYFAALTGLAGLFPDGMTDKDILVVTGNATEIANATVSAWPAMTAERDAPIMKAVEG